jgi:spore maturation protein CgeB
MGEIRVLISGTCPPHLNSNYALLREITRGFQQLDGHLGRLDVQLVPLDKLLPTVSDWRPTYTLLVGGLALETIPLAMVSHRCKLHGSRLAFWSLEDPYEFDCVLQQGHWFDLICTSDHASSCFYPGDWRVEHLPLASPERPMPATGELLRASARWMFCGVPFVNRLRWIAALVGACPQGLLIGPGWPAYAPPTAVHQGRIAPGVLHQLYAVQPLTLYLGRDQDLANSIGVIPSTPGPRLFECAGGGGRQLVCGSGLEAALYYEPELEMLPAATLGEAIGWLEWAEHHPRELLAIGERAWGRTQAEHLYRHRASRLLTWLREL